MGDFLQELWGFMRERKKFWLFAYYSGTGHAGLTYRPKAGVGRGAVYLHVVLGSVGSERGTRGRQPQGNGLANLGRTIFCFWPEVDSTSWASPNPDLSQGCAGSHAAG